MGVYIKNMEMPKNCEECPFYRYWDEMASSCEVFDETKWIDDCDMEKERHPDCPLIELPPHGDLIDRSKLAWTPIDITDLPFEECLPVYLKEDVDSAPIVVESEE